MKEGNSHRISTYFTGLILIFVAFGAWAHCEDNHTGDHPHCGGGSLVFTVGSDGSGQPFNR